MYFILKDWLAPKAKIDELKQIIDNQMVTDCIYENEKELVWMMRFECRDKFPHGNMSQYYCTLF